MLYLGIDIGKRSHVASLMSQEGKVLFKAFSFANSTDGGESLLAKLGEHVTSVCDVEIGMEATGHYWLSLYSFLVEHGYAIHVVNPIQTDGWRKGVEIRKRKTDTIDSVLIADLIRYGDFLETALADENTMSLRNLSRFRHSLVSSIGDLKRKTIAVLDQVFPEYASVFSDVFGKTSKAILMEFGSPEDLEHITSEQLENLLSQLTLKKFAAEKVQTLAHLSKRSFGVSFCRDSFTLQLRLLIQQITFIEEQVLEIEREIAELLNRINSPITTVPGIGPVNAATILGEVGDITRFSSPAKLVAYAGIDASVTQSGDFHSTRNKMSKRGSPYLRKALFQAALVASNSDPVFNAFYQKKRNEGKHHLTALGAVARKLCYTIHAILKKNCPYEVQPPPEL